ncbi:hypothetical protein SNEBB_004131 [Seison nebaliae]|nr:hypothetical protein SNEBB_004131 [Seison nebaliae]
MNDLKCVDGILSYFVERVGKFADFLELFEDLLLNYQIPWGRIMRKIPLKTYIAELHQILSNSPIVGRTSIDQVFQLYTPAITSLLNLGSYIHEVKYWIRHERQVLINKRINKFRDIDTQLKELKERFIKFTCTTKGIKDLHDFLVNHLIPNVDRMICLNKTLEVAQYSHHLCKNEPHRIVDLLKSMFNSELLRGPDVAVAAAIGCVMESPIVQVVQAPPAGRTPLPPPSLMPRTNSKRVGYCLAPITNSRCCPEPCRIPEFPPTNQYLMKSHSDEESTNEEEEGRIDWRRIFALAMLAMLFIFFILILCYRKELVMKVDGHVQQFFATFKRGRRYFHYIISIVRRRRKNSMKNNVR